MKKTQHGIKYSQNLLTVVLCDPVELGHVLPTLHGRTESSFLTSFLPRAPVGLHGDSRRFSRIFRAPNDLERASMSRVTGDESESRTTGKVCPRGSHNPGSVPEVGNNKKRILISASIKSEIEMPTCRTCSYQPT